MQNIDPIWLAEPASIIALMVGIILYWRFKRRFAVAVLLYSLLAYSAAILVKGIFQEATFSDFRGIVGQNNHAALGLYYGLQTVLLEVGAAYLVARFAVSRGKMKAQDAEGYGIGLAFWENAVLIGILNLVNLSADYAILSVGGNNSSIAQTVYNAISTSQPSLFWPPAEALPFIGYALLERVTSLLFHFSWGLLCLFAAYYRRVGLFLLALPMGLLDFLVPFEPVLGVGRFEAIIFVLGLIVLGLTLLVTRGIRTQLAKEKQAAAAAKPAV